MPYSYYNKLPAQDKKIYRASDKISNVNLKNSNHLLPFVRDVQSALKSKQKVNVLHASQALTNQLTLQLSIPPIKIKVLTSRPHNNYGELHGLYEPVSGKVKVAEISVWMLTAKRKQVVAFKTYMRTLFHEFCHHLDYEFYKLEDSYHTEGFFKRESSLYKQLVTTWL
ncbi:MAG: hypothetical protein ACRBDX_11870 [Gammaproteobacteria bacterium]